MAPLATGDDQDRGEGVEIPEVWRSTLTTVVAGEWKFKRFSLLPDSCARTSGGRRAGRGIVPEGFNQFHFSYRWALCCFLCWHPKRALRQFAVDSEDLHRGASVLCENGHQQRSYAWRVASEAGSSSTSTVVQEMGKRERGVHDIACPESLRAPMMPA